MLRYFALIVLIVIPLYVKLHANNLALPCAGCHGPNGKSPGETIPSINNLDKNYFINALKEYKSGIRENYIMRIIANGYTDAQIEILADFYEN